MNRFRGRGLKLGNLNEDVKFLIDGFVVEKGITLYYGPPGIGKSMLTLGITRYAADRGKTVQYSDYDNPLSALKERGADFLIDEERYPNIDYIHPEIAVDDDNIPMEPDEVLDELVRGAKSEAYVDVLFVIDSLTDFVTDVQNGKLVKEFFKKVKALRNAGGTVVIIHHANKDEKNFQGHASILSAPDNVFRLSKGTDDVFLLSVTKGRFGVRDHAFTVDKAFNLEAIVYEEAKISDADREFISQVKKALASGELPQSKLLSTIGRRKEDRKARQLLETYAGRFWNRESGPNNSLIYSKL